MNQKIDIRETLPTDRKTLENLYPTVFPDEDLIPLLRDLLNEKDNVFSFTATCNEMLVGHVVFTMCHILEGNEKSGLLGPVAVHPSMQKQGIGSALIQKGLSRMKEEGAGHIYVFGDPAYYGRFGFTSTHHVMPPYDLPQEWKTAWQSLCLDDTNPNPKGMLSVPKPWSHPELWLP